MLGHELAVEQREIADLEARDQPGERDLRRVGRAAEHAFAEEGAAELHAVEAADQRVAVPHLDRMGVARAVEREHRVLELGVDPGLLAVGAGGDHAGEIAVAGDREPARAERPAERARDVEAVERDDRAVARLDPEQLVRVAAVGHREDAGGIALKQQARVERDSSPLRMLQDLAHLVLRAAEADAVGGFDDRALDQDRMLDHRVEHLVVGDVGAGEAELLGQRLLGAQALARA